MSEKWVPLTKGRIAVIHDMCQTWRHDYGLEISDEDRKASLLSAGMTPRERSGLFDSMAQVLDNAVIPSIDSGSALVTDLNQLVTKEHQSKEDLMAQLTAILAAHKH